MFPFKGGVMARYIKICAWCGKEISREEIPGEEDIISHGMCKECYEREMARIRKTTGVLSEEDVLHQAESFLSYWGRLGGDMKAAFDRWVSSKDFLPEDRERVLKAVEAIRPDAERYLKEVLGRKP